ncbi:MAG TPA: NAD-glutamate dehydrogenase [Mycobacteriales bacterium]|nr:NAD-glutamate dehydrogenase [Mycobacteriales bacterium]
MTLAEHSTGTTELLDAAARHAPPQLHGFDVHALLRSYYRHADEVELEGRDAAAVLGAARSHLELARSRRPGTAAVRVHNPTRGDDGWTVRGTVVEVVSEDMPFLVDSITAELARQGCAITLVLHPVVTVRRGADGSLTGAEPDDGDPESWVHVEVERETSPERLAAVEAGLRAVLADVRAAVQDWGAMSATASQLADSLLAEPPAGVPRPEAEEAAELLRWLAEDHATLLGYAEYALVERDGSRRVEVVEGSTLGLLRLHGAGPDGPVGSAPQRLLGDGRARLLVVSKAPTTSTVHRPAYLDSIALRRFDASGAVVGEHRLVGLFAAAAYTESIHRVPVVRQKARAVLRRSGFSSVSHSGRELLDILETYPRDELFQAGVDDLHRVAQAVMHLKERRRLRLFLRRDEDASYMSCLVYLPRDRYSSQVRLRMQRVLTEALSAVDVEYSVRLTESVLARVHFVARAGSGRTLSDVDPQELEQRLAAVARSWDDEFAELLRDALGDDEAARLAKELPDPFPEAYKADYPASTGVADLRRVVGLGDDGLGMHLYEDAPGELRFKVYSRQSLPLTAVLPVLQDMAVEVVDSRPYRLAGAHAHVYDFGLHAAGELHRDGQGLAELFQETFAAVWAGRVESDGLNALVLRGGLTSRQVAVLRAYAKYLRQGGWSFTPSYVEECLSTHAGVARLLVGLFESQFAPDQDTDRSRRCEALVAELEEALEEIPSLDEDRILRSFLSAVLATTRTNHYRPGENGGAACLSLKLRPASIPGLPFPRPEREVWVYSPRVEGVHLRFGAVARGGLRWSDRREDFRTEVLGLVKAQAVKNAVIVPVGAKGGFLAKRLPDPAEGREQWMAEGVECYRTFIRGLLDVTDNLVDGQVVPPPGVVRRDDDDTYLVVAADKGTATFSDIANEVAAEYGFWLGDAFASGGSVGYDHKAMGITARGAWVSVQRHFHELGVDPQVDEITVVGIGDMSGDVFGNGMLLSRSLKLVAAFDHRHIFLDPDPDPATSFAERERLFALERSSWLDYDTALLSEGGGVHSRSAKSVPVTPQVRARLGLPESCTRLTPAELLTACLRAPVDLLWNGGIGTWVKASGESSADVGDKANDAVRVDAVQLRCRVIGEGGNLGLTQLGRIEAAQSGVRVNTDAIDNSAGVDCSDHEVNIKVLLDQLVRAGELSRSGRDELLVEMTDEVARLVLRDNAGQNVLLGNARANARSMLPVHRRYLRQLEAEGALDRDLEFLPSDSELDARAAAGAGLTTPEFAVLTAYAKNTVKAHLLGTDLPGEPWFERHLLAYFPTQLRERFPDAVQQHPLRRQIIATSVVNEMVNLAGTSFVFRAVEETEAPVEQVVRAYSVATEVFGMRAHWRAVDQLSRPVPVTVQTGLHLEARRLVDRVVRRLLPGRQALDVAAQVRRYRPTVAALLPLVPELVRDAQHTALHERVARREEQGAPHELALRSVSLLHAFPLLDVVDLAEDADESPEDVAPLYYALAALFDVDTHLERITDLPRTDRWQALARSALRDELYAATAGLTADALRTTSAGPADQRLESWVSQRERPVAAAKARLQEVTAGEVFDLAAMSVVVRTVRGVLRS